MTGFRMPTRILIEPGCRHRLSEILATHGWSRVLLIVDPGLSATVWPQDLRDHLTQAGAAVEVFDALLPNPRLSSAKSAADLARDHRADVLVALGGGSALDTAKAAAMLATNHGDPLEFVGKNRFATDPLPMIALPTTCGTGSEVTWVSVLTDPDAHTKVSIKGDGMFPDVALVDSDYLETLPPSLIAATAMDAMTHAVEAYIGTEANPISDALAEKAIALLWHHLAPCYTSSGRDGEARNQVARASTLAGMAFGNADVAGVHCLSESLGAMFDVPHGLANAILLVPVLRYQRAVIVARLDRLMRRVAPGFTGDAETGATAFLEGLAALGSRVDIPPFAALDIPGEALGQVAEKAEANGSNPSNPMPMAAEDYLHILRALLG
ncbi:Iron-containing alcohol dehydrogenase [Sulfidibacter corallicola]|uniref:Iron-containing alcohol dehydrogenase n=1 Tax=Sulfidibacter corallicola TaxID=2818388 RepID=A0A8A4TJC4_SULCO|nr:iron-containing alcohol dehydrogenase [Sulfidibacter corallicola]QTD50129.1 iron-containing alcohol dehydrogenase [Sulfidibacter corallicola]